MGALHAGHARLMERARAECLTVVVSIFVNPLQFDRAEDLARYPRPLEADLAVCGQLGVDVVFAPTPAVMYPQPPDCTVHVGRTAAHLCGAFRPGHFDGVATVVLKLLDIVQPDVAYFGEKDAQQLAIVQADGGRLQRAGHDCRRAHRARGRRPGAQLAQPAPQSRRSGRWRHGSSAP